MGLNHDPGTDIASDRLAGSNIEEGRAGQALHHPLRDKRCRHGSGCLGITLAQGVVRNVTPMSGGVTAAVLLGCHERQVDGPTWQDLRLCQHPHRDEQRGITIGSCGHPALPCVESSVEP